MQKTPGLGNPRDFLKGIENIMPPDSPGLTKKGKHNDSNMSNEINDLKRDISNNRNEIGELRNRFGFLENQFYRKKQKTKRGLFRGGRKRQIFNTSRGPFSSSPFSSSPFSSSPFSSSPFRSSSNPFRRRGPFGGKRKKTRKQKRKSRTRRRR